MQMAEKTQDGGSGDKSAGPLSSVDSTEIFTYTAPWVIYAMSFSTSPHFPYRLALGSFLETHSNRIEVVQLNRDTKRFELKSEFDHPYPPTKIMWVPDLAGSRPDLIATSGDCIRIWQCGEQVSIKASLINTRNVDYSAPLTSFDWNQDDPTLLGTASIDTTCTIWDVEKETVKTQLIAHDKEVYDFAFNKGVFQFASVGADGSVRLFDLRNLQHSNIIYESPIAAQLLRLAWNRLDEHYLATIAMDCDAVTILDIRSPAMPVAELAGHHGNVNALSWAPHSTSHICTVGDDSQALIWDLQRPIQGNHYSEPILSYTSEAEISALQWSQAQSEWVAIAYNQNVQMLRV